MANVKKYTDQIAKAQKGRDVRDAIVNAINAVSDENNEYNQVKADILETQTDITEKVAKNEQTEQTFAADVKKVEELKQGLDTDITQGTALKSQLDDTIKIADTSKKNLDASNATAGQTKTALDGSVSNAQTLEQSLDSDIAQGTILKTDLESNITQGTVLKSQLDDTVKTADTSKKNLDISAETAGTIKESLESSIETAKSTRTALDNSNTVATQTKTALDNSNDTAGATKTALDESISNAGTSKQELDSDINQGNTLKTQLETTISTADTSKKNLDASNTAATKTKADLDTSNTTATKTKADLDTSNTTASETKTGLDATNKTATGLVTSLGDKIAEGTQVKNDIQTTGETAMSNLQAEAAKQQEHIKASIDDTLSISGKAADAAVTGKKISSLKEGIVDCLKGTGIEVNNKTAKPFTDFNDVKTNSVYSVAVKDLLNMPVQKIGVLITIGYKTDSNFGCTQWYIVDGDVYVRFLNGTWGAWEKLYNAKNKDSDFVSNFNYMFPNAFDAKVSSTGIFKGRINTVKPSDNFDFDELKESVCVYNEDKNANGLPENDFGTMICFANKGKQTYGVFQVYSTYYTHRTYIRYRTGTWNEWKEIVTKDYFDNNFDAFPFTCFGVIGDSLASGCSNYQNSQGAWKGKDIPKFSWGKYIERKYGVECTLFTKGGTTTRSWLNGEWGKSLLESSKPLEMYYIGLGNNDYYSLGASYLGSTSDIHIGNEEQNADTYYGNYSKIIAAIKSKSPRAKVFCFTEPNKNKDAVCHLFNEAVRNIIEMYDNVFLFDLEYNKKYIINGIFKSFEYGSHYVSPGYKLMAEFIYKMTSDYILNNSNDFMDIQWITENHD